MKALTPKQMIFAHEYCVTKNGTQAAIKAGYSKKSAPDIATENLRKPNIKAAIQTQLKKEQLVCNYTKLVAHKELEDLRQRFNEENNKFGELKAITEKIKLHSLSTTNINMEVKTLVDYIDELDEN